MKFRQGKRIGFNFASQARQTTSILVGYRTVVWLVFLCILSAAVLGCGPKPEPEPIEIRTARIMRGLKSIWYSDPNFARAFEQHRVIQAWEQTRYTVGGESREPLYIGCDNDDR